MKKIIVLVVTILVTSCKSQNENLNLDSSKVKEISITNKVSYSIFYLNDEKIIINSTSQINKIIECLNSSKKLNNSPSLNANYGFFDLHIFEEDKKYSFNIVYSVYHGVIVVESNSTNRYKNDELESLIVNLFRSK